MKSAKLALLVVGCVVVLVVGCSSTPKEKIPAGYGLGVSNEMRVTKDKSEDICPDVSPDGDRVAFCRRAPEWGANYDIWVVDARLQREPQRITDHDSDDLRPVWAPSGESVLFDSHRASTRTIFEKSASGRGGVLMITHDEKAGGKTNDSDVTVSADGKIAYVAVSSKGYDVEETLEGIYPSKAEVVVVDGSGRELSRVNGIHPRWAPDGTKLVFASNMGRTVGQKIRGIVNRDIWVMNADGSSLRQLTWHSGDDVEPCFSPDGQSIAFVSNRAHSGGNDEVYDLWAINADGTGLSQLISSDAQERRPAWGADGFIYYGSNKAGQWDIWRLRPTTGRDSELAGTFVPLRGIEPIGKKSDKTERRGPNFISPKAPVAGAIWTVANIPCAVLATGAMIVDAVTLFRATIYGPSPLSLAEDYYVPYADVYDGLWD